MYHVQYTDHATTKLTEFLRRRCSNCSTTDPPSWRRSTLKQGKIVCNKCGLYERAHCRARPKFDKLRVGGQRGDAAATADRSPTKASKRADGKATNPHSSAGIASSCPAGLPPCPTSAGIPIKHRASTSLSNLSATSDSDPPLIQSMSSSPLASLNLSYPPPGTRDNNSQSPHPGSQGTPIHTQSVSLDASSIQNIQLYARTPPHFGHSLYGFTAAPLSISSISNLSNSSLSSFHQRQPIEGSLDQINNPFGIPLMGSLLTFSHFGSYHPLPHQHHYNLPSIPASKDSIA